MNNIKTVSNSKELGVELKNKEIVDVYISSYQEQTKSAIGHILNMCATVYEINEKVLKRELTFKDLKYFCDSVSLDRKSSYFRKHICIGKHAEIFKQYLEKLPSAVSVLYQIATLDSDKFEELVKTDQITPGITLRELKLISSSTPVDEKFLPSTYSIKFKFDARLIDKSRLEKLVEICNELQGCEDISVDFDKVKLNSLLKFYETDKKLAA